MTPEQKQSLITFDLKRKERCEKIMERYKKEPVKYQKGGYKPLTNKEIKMFKNMGSVVTIIDTTSQKSLF